MHKVHPLVWNAPATDFAETHYVNCAPGWTRSDEGGVRVVVCLLDREPVLPALTGCDRFKLCAPSQLTAIPAGIPASRKERHGWRPPRLPPIMSTSAVIPSGNSIFGSPKPAEGREHRPLRLAR